MKTVTVRKKKMKLLINNLYVTVYFLHRHGNLNVYDFMLM